MTKENTQPTARLLVFRAPPGSTVPIRRAIKHRKLLVRRARTLSVERVPVQNARRATIALMHLRRPRHAQPDILRLMGIRRRARGDSWSKRP